MITGRYILILEFVIILIAGWCIAQENNAAGPSTQQSTTSWRLVITRSLTEDKEGHSTFIVTVINTGQTEQALFTPGLVGPNLWSNTALKSEPYEMHIASRPKDEYIRDCVYLRPGEGFSRVSNTLSAKQVAEIGTVSAYLMIYQKGFEGHSQKVFKVIDAPIYELHKTEK